PTLLHGLPLIPGGHLLRFQPVRKSPSRSSPSCAVSRSRLRRSRSQGRRTTLATPRCPPADRRGDRAFHARRRPRACRVPRGRASSRKITRSAGAPGAKRPSVESPTPAPLRHVASASASLGGMPASVKWRSSFQRDNPGTTRAAAYRFRASVERLLRGAAHERELLRPRVAHQRVAAAGTATSAAAEIGITQSALSQQLLDLAQRLAERLFERTGRRMVPTAFGAQFLERPRPPLDEMAQLRAWLLERRPAP